LTWHQQRVFNMLRDEVAEDLTRVTGIRWSRLNVSKSAVWRVLLDAEAARRSML